MSHKRTSMAQQQASSSSFLGPDMVDEFYFYVVSYDETDPDVPVSDYKYAVALQFQETLMASVTTSYQSPSSSSYTSKTGCVASSSKTVNEDVEVVLNTKQIMFTTEEETNDESSSIIICEICAEAKKNEEMFRIQRCYHSFCSECVVKQVATKIQDNITVVSCPGLNCKGALELESCRALLPKELADKWNDALCEALFINIPKFYCPFKDCSAMLLDENEGGEENIRESECPFCHRLFCASCHVPWHSGIGCEEFQKLNVDEREKEDLLLRELANQEKWKRCPKCKFYIELCDGCNHITCRCLHEFCYFCGEQWTFNHSGCLTRMRNRSNLL